MTARALLLLAALAASACDGAFDPVAPDGPAFALHGVLDGRRATQALRVQDLRGSTFDTPDQLAATVTSTELGSGRTSTWRDSLATIEGVPAHVFVAPLAVRAGETHRVVVVRSEDGARSSATVRIPEPTATAGPPSPTASAAVRVALDGLEGRYGEAVVRYRVRRTDGSGETSFTAPATIQRIDGAISFLAFLAPAEARAAQLLYPGAPPGAPSDAVLLDARLETVVTNAEASAVENGVGTLGWTVSVSVPIPLSAEALAQVGFVDGRG